MIYIILILTCIYAILFLLDQYVFKKKNIKYNKHNKQNKPYHYLEEEDDETIYTNHQQQKQFHKNKILRNKLLHLNNNNLKQEAIDKHFKKDYTFPLKYSSPVISLVPKSPPPLGQLSDRQLAKMNNFNIEQLKKSDKKCYGNDFCDLQDLCIEQKCVKCGLRAPCSKDSDCGPNNCLNGCCDNQ
jgi:hypothetical protein